MSEHWNNVYATRGVDERSWSETEPTTSLELLDELGVTPRDSILDIGAGESELVDHLRARGFTDLSVLDLSGTALGATRERIGHDNVVTIEADVTTWHPTRSYDVWHDRAVLHFLSAPDALRYASTLRDALSPSGAVVIGVFAPDGPESCSGLAVTRYGADDLAALLGEEFRIVTERRVRHRTPWGSEQSFQWIAARRDERASQLSASERMAE
jgi:trans-aconitate methyltransferase